MCPKDSNFKLFLFEQFIFFFLLYDSAKRRSFYSGKLGSPTSLNHKYKTAEK